MPLPRPTFSPLLRRPSRLWPALVLLTLLLGTYLAGNGATALWDRDEPRYAVTSRQMLESGDWVVPEFLGRLRNAKPPMTYWLQATAMAGLGTGDFAARLPGAICVAAAAVVLWAGASPVVGRRRAWWGAFVFGTSVLAMGTAKFAITDGPLVLCTTLMGVAVLHLSYRPGPARPVMRSGAAWAMLWISAGVGGLVKGPVVLGILFTALLAFTLFSWRTGDRTLLWKRTAAWWGVPLAVLICLPWVIAVELREPGFVLGALRHDVGTRAATGLEGHGFPPGFHLLVSAGTFFPWSLLAPGALLMAWRGRRLRRSTRLLLAMVVGPWVMFELVATKLPHYTLPLFPWLGLIVAGWLANVFRGRHPVKIWERRLAAVLYAVIILALAVPPWVLGVPWWAATAAGLVSLAWAWWTAKAWWLGRVRRGVLSSGLGAAAYVAVAYAVWLPLPIMLDTSRDVAAALADDGAAYAVMIGYKEGSLGWYAGNRGVVMRESDDAPLYDPDAFALDHDGRRLPLEFAVTTMRHYRELPPEVRRAWEVRTSVEARLYNDALRSADVVVLRYTPPGNSFLRDQGVTGRAIARTPGTSPAGTDRPRRGRGV